MDGERTRTITWDDPTLMPALAAGMTGREALQAMLDGRVPGPPIMQTMNLVGTAVGDGVFEARCDPDESQFNPLGVIHGGVVSSLLDTVIGCATHSTLGVGVGYTSIDLHVRFLRPVLPASGPLIGTGRVVKPGRRVVFADGEVRDRTGALVATATSSLLVLA